MNLFQLVLQSTYFLYNSVWAPRWVAPPSQASLPWTTAPTRHSVYFSNKQSLLVVCKTKHCFIAIKLLFRRNPTKNPWSFLIYTLLPLGKIPTMHSLSLSLVSSFKGHTSKPFEQLMDPHLLAFVLWAWAWSILARLAWALGGWLNVVLGVGCPMSLGKPLSEYYELTVGVIWIHPITYDCRLLPGSIQISCFEVGPLKSCFLQYVECILVVWPQQVIWILGVLKWKIICYGSRTGWEPALSWYLELYSNNAGHHHPIQKNAVFYLPLSTEIRHCEILINI